MSDATTRAAARIREAIKDKTRNFRGPNEEREYVELAAGDVATLCAAAPDQADEVVHAQTKGCGTAPPTRKVVIYADDAFHLLDLAGMAAV